MLARKVLISKLAEPLRIYSQVLIYAPKDKTTLQMVLHWTVEVPDASTKQVLELDHTINSFDIYEKLTK